MFSLFAFILSAFVVSGGGAPDALQVAVDWFAGFTGHTDGLLMAAAPILAAVPGVVQKTEPEPTPAASGDGVAFEPDAIRAIVREVMGEAIGELRQAPAQGGTNPIVEVAGSDVQNRTRVIGDVVPNWQRRAVALLNLMAARKVGDERVIAQASRRLTELNEAVTPQLIEAERKMTRDILGRRFTGMDLERAMSTLTDGAGGFAVPTPMAAEIYNVTEEHGLGRQYSRSVPVMNKSLDLTSIGTKPTVYWAAELADFTESNPVLVQEALTPSKLTALMSWSRELDEDEAVALLPVRITLIGEGFAEQEDLAFFQGDGSTYGSTLGLLKTTGQVTVTQTATQTTQASVSLAYMKQLRDALTLRRRRGASYFMHPDIKSLLETEAFGTAATNLPGITRAANGEMDRIWGYPVVMSEDMPATAAAAEEYVVFGNPRDYVMRGEKGGITIQTSTEGVINDGSNLVTFNAIQNDGVILAARERIAFAIPDAFQASFAVLKTAAS